LGGFWHGAGWSYALWGTGHGAFLAFERLIKDKIKIKETILVQTINTLIVFLVVTFLWLLFKLPNFGQVLDFLKALTNNTGMKFVISSKEVNLVILSSFVVVYHIYYLLLKFHKIDIKINQTFQQITYGVLLFLIVVNSGDQSAFIYFQF